MSVLTVGNSKEDNLFVEGYQDGASSVIQEGIG